MLLNIAQTFLLIALEELNNNSAMKVTLELYVKNVIFMVMSGEITTLILGNILAINALQSQGTC
jgi:hypothetical protein